MYTWKEVANELQQLDVLLSTEDRSLQQAETVLAKHVDDALEIRLTSDRILASLRSGRNARESVISLPAKLRPHLRWTIRAIRLLREPALLAWLLTFGHSALNRARVDLGLDPDQSQTDRLAESVSALFDAHSPADRARQHVVLAALCEIELEQNGHLMSLLGRGSLTACLLREFLVQCPVARQFLQRAWRGELESWLDSPINAMRRVQRHRDLRGKVSGARRPGDGVRPLEHSVCVNPDDYVLETMMGEAGQAEDWQESTVASATAMLPDPADDLFSVCERLLAAVAQHAAALPTALLLVCSAAAAAAHCAGGSVEGAIAAGEAAVAGWLVPVLEAPQAFGLRLLTVGEEGHERAQLRHLSELLARSARMHVHAGAGMDARAGEQAEAAPASAPPPAGDVDEGAARLGAIETNEVEDEGRLRRSVEALGRAILHTARCDGLRAAVESAAEAPGGTGSRPSATSAATSSATALSFTSSRARLTRPPWDSTLPLMASLTPAQLLTLLTLLRNACPVRLGDAHAAYAARHVGGAAALLPSQRVRLKMVLDDLDLEALLGPPLRSRAASSVSLSRQEVEAAVASVAAESAPQAAEAAGAEGQRVGGTEGGGGGTEGRERGEGAEGQTVGGKEVALQMEAAAAAAEMAAAAALEPAELPSPAAPRVPLASPVAGLLPSLPANGLLRIPLNCEDDVRDEYAKVLADEMRPHTATEGGPQAVAAPHAGDATPAAAAPAATTPSAVGIDESTVNVLCNLLRRLKPCERSSRVESLLPWLQVGAPA